MSEFENKLKAIKESLTSTASTAGQEAERKLAIVEDAKRRVAEKREVSKGRVLSFNSEFLQPVLNHVLQVFASPNGKIEKTLSPTYDHDDPDGIIALDSHMGYKLKTFLVWDRVDNGDSGSYKRIGFLVEANVADENFTVTLVSGENEWVSFGCNRTNALSKIESEVPELLSRPAEYTVHWSEHQKIDLSRD